MENREGAQNRTFIIVAIGLAALLIVGLGLRACSRYRALLAVLWSRLV